MKCPSEFQRAENDTVLQTRSANTPAYAKVSDTTEFRPESQSPSATRQLSASAGQAAGEHKI